MWEDVEKKYCNCQSMENLLSTIIHKKMEHLYEMRGAAAVGRCAKKSWREIGIVPPSKSTCKLSFEILYM